MSYVGDRGLERGLTDPINRVLSDSNDLDEYFVVINLGSRNIFDKKSLVGLDDQGFDAGGDD